MTIATGNVAGWRNEVDDLVRRMRADMGPLPYDPTPDRLYGANDLYSGFDDGGFGATVDQKIYERARIAGGPILSPVEEIAQRLHDHGISLALNEFRATRRLLGVMGGHAMQRGSSTYADVVALGRASALAGLCVTTGGGPGAMEAANLGAATAAWDSERVDALVGELAKHPSFYNEPDAFIGSALEAAVAIAESGDVTESLAVPTWFYGHEPSNPFATHIAKYFSNSEREAGLLAIADAGIVFVPGGPGTMQEVFQDGAQNAYRTFDGPYPMVFLDPSDDPGWWDRSGVPAAIDQVFIDGDGTDRPGRDLLFFADSVAEVMQAVTPTNR